MKLSDIVNRKIESVPWTEGEKIPWNDPEFSQRMLLEHLSQNHDAASRRFEIIDRHVAWIHDELLKKRPSRMVDLGCGPGFYTSRLAGLGHSCKGIDFSPASIEYARQKALEEKTGCEYLLHDLRSCDFGSGFDLVILVYGEFNTFQKADARLIIEKALNALNPGGRLLIELDSVNVVKSIGQAQPGWHTAQSGLFSNTPYLFLEEGYWNEELQSSTRRMYVIDAGSAEVVQMADNHQAYSEAQIRQLALDCGFEKANTFSGWPIQGLEANDHSLLLVAVKSDH